MTPALRTSVAIVLLLSFSAEAYATRTDSVSGPAGIENEGREIPAPMGSPGDSVATLTGLEGTSLPPETVLRLRQKLTSAATALVDGTYGSVVLFGPTPHTMGLGYSQILSDADSGLPSVIPWSEIRSIDVLGTDSSEMITGFVVGSALGALIVVPFTRECDDTQLFDIFCGAKDTDVLIGALAGGLIGLGASAGRGHYVWKRVRW